MAAGTGCTLVRADKSKRPRGAALRELRDGGLTAEETWGGAGSIRGDMRRWKGMGGAESKGGV